MPNVFKPMVFIILALGLIGCENRKIQESENVSWCGDLKYITTSVDCTSACEVVGGLGEVGIGEAAPS